MAQEPDIDVGAITEALNNKVDTDVGNVNTTGSAQIVRYAMPSTANPVSLTPSNNATYNATVDGYIYLRGVVASSGAHIMLSITRTSDNTPLYGFSQYQSTTYYDMKNMIPISAGMTATITYSNVDSVIWRFIYAKGSEPQS